MKMSKNIFALALCLGIIGTMKSTLALAAEYACPPPNQVNCVPATPSIGPWVANGGQMTGNSYAPNNQCANVISLSADEQRLLCCYTKCGVFLQDVKARRCVKRNEGKFVCQ